MDLIYAEIQKVFQKYPDIIYGVASLDYSELKSSYDCSLVFAVPHSKLLGLNEYNEEKFDALIGETYHRINCILNEIIKLLEENQIPYYLPPVAQTGEAKLLAPFSFKYASVKAGLGWIGKNDVLITEQYGPRVRLSAICMDYKLPIGEAITNSRCPNDCTICVDSCPYHTLSGIQWDITKKREELIDYNLCNEKRSIYIKTHNRKHSCGLCLVSCPYGLREESV